MFLTLMVIGLVGLVMMAIPAFGRHGHGHAPPRLGHGHGHGGHTAGPSKHMAVADGAAPAGATRFIPSPRAIFSVLALYGAFGNALVQALHIDRTAAALLAVLPALAVERYAVTPLWNLIFRLQGKPSSPLEELILAEARAVTPFRNGRGIVSIVRDGRLVQFPARLGEDQAALPVRVGERLRIEDVDARNERLTVSVLKE